MLKGYPNNKLLKPSFNSLTQIYISSIKTCQAFLSVCMFFENLIMILAKLRLGRRETYKLYFITSVDLQKKGCSYV